MNQSKPNKSVPYQKSRNHDLPRLDRRQGGLVLLCYDFLSDIPDEEKKYKLKKIRQIAIHLSKTDSVIKDIMKNALIIIYGITGNDKINECVDKRITIHIEAFNPMVHDILEHLLKIGPGTGYSEFYE